MRLNSFQRIVLTTTATVAVFALLLLFKPAGPERGGGPPDGGFPVGATQTGTR
ncbi:hypothetical protein [Kutzneria sp. NPDC052558]|uniref:hypothetical protein n=1 Tax=Kutzneria sp. NPDC052558 TaxID=3364121 RepID=UPI0037C9A6E5